MKAIEEAWAAGDAVLPLDRRLASEALARIIDSLRPGAILDEDGIHIRRDGIPVLEGDAIVCATSGTTSDPKGVVLTHDAVRSSALATSGALGADPGEDRWLACLPLAHIGGLSVVTRALVTGTALAVHDGFSAEEVMREARAGATLVSLVATALLRIDATAFRRILLGAGPPPEERPPNTITTYGMTETGSGCVYDGLPLEGVQVRVDAGAPGSAGPISLAGPMLLRCYRSASGVGPAGTAGYEAAVRTAGPPHEARHSAPREAGPTPEGIDPKTPDGWFATADAGYMDASGRLHVSGRLDDVIATGGEKVWPAQVEAVLAQHPAVREVGVAGAPDQRWGERVVAFIACEHDQEPPDLEDLRELVSQRVAPWAAPKELVIMDTLPRTALGKLQRKVLARSFRSLAGSGDAAT